MSDAAIINAKVAKAFDAYKKDNFAIFARIKKEMTGDELDELNTVIDEYLETFKDV